MVPGLLSGRGSWCCIAYSNPIKAFSDCQAVSTVNPALYPGEVVAVKREHVDLEARTLVMDRGKTGVLRVAVVWRRTVQAIRNY